jgi:putative flippase GtrA
MTVGPRPRGGAAARAAVLPTVPGDPLEFAVRKSFRQFIKFCFVGASGVVVNLAVFNATLLLWQLAAGDAPHAAEYLANLLGFVVSVMTNYYLNRRWTFRSTGAVATELPKFFAVSVVAYVVNLGVFTLARHGLDLSENVSQLVAIACVMPINFILNKLWSFRGT